MSLYAYVFSIHLKSGWIIKIWGFALCPETKSTHYTIRKCKEMWHDDSTLVCRITPDDEPVMTASDGSGEDFIASSIQQGTGGRSWQERATLQDDSKSGMLPTWQKRKSKNLNKKQYYNTTILQRVFFSNNQDEFKFYFANFHLIGEGRVRLCVRVWKSDWIVFILYVFWLRDCLISRRGEKELLILLFSQQKIKTIDHWCASSLVIKNL